MMKKNARGAADNEEFYNCWPAVTLRHEAAPPTESIGVAFLKSARSNLKDF